MKRLLFLVPFLLIISPLWAQVNMKISYHPGMFGVELPFEISVDKNGISIDAQLLSFLTPIGRFSLSAGHTIEVRKSDVSIVQDNRVVEVIKENDFVLIIRYSDHDKVYRIKDGTNIKIHFEGIIDVNAINNDSHTIVIVYKDWRQQNSYAKNYQLIRDNIYHISDIEGNYDRFVEIPSEAKYFSILIQDRGPLKENTSWYYLSPGGSRDDFLNNLAPAVVVAFSKNERVLIAYANSNKQWVNTYPFRIGTDSNNFTELVSGYYWHPNEQKPLPAWEITGY